MAAMIGATTKTHTTISVGIVINAGTLIESSQVCTLIGLTNFFGHSILTPQNPSCWLGGHQPHMNLVSLTNSQLEQERASSPQAYSSTGWMSRMRIAYLIETLLITHISNINSIIITMLISSHIYKPWRLYCNRRNNEHTYCNLYTTSWTSFIKYPLYPN